jgi:hypothetical protein
MSLSNFTVSCAERCPALQSSSYSRRNANSDDGHTPTNSSTEDSISDDVLMDTFSALTHSSDESRLYTPDILSHISSCLRMVTLSTNSLWTFVVVTFPFAAGQIARATAALSRSKNRPINVLVDLRDRDWTWESDEERYRMRSVFMVEIMQQLEPSHPRWRSLTVLTDTWVPMHAFLAYSTMSTPLPKLEQSGSVELFDGNAFLPKLRHVTLAGVHVDYSCTRFRSRGLLSLDLRHQSPKIFPTTQQLRRISRASPGL